MANDDKLKYQKHMEQLDTSSRKLVQLKGGRNAIIQGKGLELGGTVDSVDLTDMPDEEFEQVKRNYGKMTVERKGDKITLKPKAGVKGVKAMTIKDVKRDK